MSDSVYKIVGGREVVLAAVNNFYRRVVADPSLGPFFKNVDVNHLVARQSMFLTMLLGGGPPEARDTIRAAHAPSRALGLTDAHFNAFLKHFRASLQEIKVPPDKLEEIMILLEHSRASVMGH